MSETLSLSIFTIEADRKPLLAFAAKKHKEAEAFCADERVLTKLRSVRSSGVPLCDDHSILHVRLATSDERARYHERTKQRSSMEHLAAVFLVDVEKHSPRRRAVAAPVRYFRSGLPRSKWGSGTARGCVGT
jgi:hypothetical protein